MENFLSYMLHDNKMASLQGDCLFLKILVQQSNADTSVFSESTVE
jgi:hypothetical protein